MKCLFFYQHQQDIIAGAACSICRMVQPSALGEIDPQRAMGSYVQHYGTYSP